MYVARLLYPVEVLGVGKRVGLWFVGCPHHCRGCSNPELWEFQPRYAIRTEHIIALIQQLVREHPADGLTITGGEPFFQPEALHQIVTSALLWTKDILVYSGFTLSELREMKHPDVDAVLSKIAVLVDGVYIPEQNGTCPLRGSDNQQIHIFRSELRNVYEKYLLRERQIQNFMQGNSVISVGLHHADFQFSGIAKEATE